MYGLSGEGEAKEIVGFLVGFRNDIVLGVVLFFINDVLLRRLDFIL